MKIKVLGTRGYVEASKPWHSKHSGLLINDELLFDAGEKEFLEHDPKAIFFTHFHPDHAYFVKEEKSVSFDVPVYGPEESELLDGLTVTDEEEIEHNGYTIKPIPTIHSLKVESQAYLIKKDDTKILYTADMVWILKDYHHLFEGLDAVITEASFMRKGGMVRRKEESGKIYGHTGVPDLVNLFTRFTKRIIFMHYGTWFLEDVPAGRKKIKDLQEGNVKLQPARDGQEFEIKSC